ncbi:MAG: UTP--glucose-1-phosphate uridylyltransferase, partial [Bdellovibrionales bacterium]|nr:UTP--glucose-1-phosphate uridylyltransferase [Bdellovibrionales bacterium]
FDQVVHGGTGLVPSSTLNPVEDLPTFESLTSFTRAGQEALSSLVVMKLNGGLGTSMGLDKAKSLLPAKKGQTFLDIICGQILDARKRFQADTPLVFMNSFRTQDDTLAALERYSEIGQTRAELPLSFLQGRVPKIEKETLSPFCWDANRELEWCPPGHGDIYTSLLESGYLEKALDAGYLYAFISNSDNLGATLDPAILGYLVSENIPFLMEVAERTAADRKGGHLARDSRGRLLLRELAQCPAEDEEDFQDYKKYTYFNTNSLWIHLPSLKSLLDERDGILGLPLIRNEKPGDPRDESSPRVYQLETAMGTAISSFAHSQALLVPRSRFLPVKTTDDLLELWSDRFELDEHYCLQKTSRCTTPSCVIHLDSQYYRKVDDFDERFSQGIPSLVDCEELRIEGDIAFHAPVSFCGSVTLKNTESSQQIVSSKEDLNNFVASS